MFDLVRKTGEIMMNGTEEYTTPVENIATDIWGAMWSPYTAPFAPSYVGVFWGFIMGAIAVVMYMKTDEVAVPLVVILLMASTGSVFMSPVVAKYFIIAAGGCFGVLIYYLLTEA